MRFQLRNVIFFIAAFVFTPFAWMVLFSNTDLNENTLLEQKLAELRDRLHYAESLNTERENDVHILRSQIRVLLSSQTFPNGSAPKKMDLPRETLELFGNMSQGTTDLSVPGMFNYLPHLIRKPGGLKPSFKISRGRVGVTMVLGIPTIKRDRESYLRQTLDSLINNLDESEKEDCVIIVFVAEQRYNMFGYVCNIYHLHARFKEHMESGLLEVIAPSVDFYPSFDNLRETFGDSLERVKWRTKQNLDFSYLMMYARSKGTYYVQLQHLVLLLGKKNPDMTLLFQLEDDIITKPGYLSLMKTFTMQQQVDEWILLEFSKLGFIEDDVITKPGYHSVMKNFALNQKVEDWFLLEFSYLGFIGKLFKSRDLPLVVEFFLMFHKDKPIDWLLDHLLFVKVCNPEKDRKHCQHSIAELRRRFKPSLFQHIGTHSSLKGKVQKLKVFYLFHSGNSEHPGDKFYNTTIEILPVDHIVKADGILSNQIHEHGYSRTEDGYLVINEFREGVAKGNVNESIGAVDTLRLRVLSQSETWVILSEIMIKSKAKKT
ncbi:hypothetical protein LSH36_3g29011 [Paralvinella palmiformis]|uniref:Uncharacterized protein n=1 Tax=Paralvinella palmiformis TaxID=53620 RepID=A0AAD9NJB9_9ANNE|nr:hypothetical protein LSH36_3g29011 [Paralvinella palmiformis]